MVNLRIYLLGVLLFLGVGAVLAVTVRYQQKIGAARAALNQLNSQVIETACGPIEYARVGEGSPVLVVHGTMGGFDQGLFVAKPVIAAGYQVISISRFGYLRSPLPVDADLNRQADAYACLLDELHIQQVAVFTFSGGASSSIRFAARHPERLSALILLAPAAPGNVKVQSPPRAIFDTMMRSDFAYWAMITFFRSSGYRLLGVPEGFSLTPAYKAELDESLDTTLPISGRIDGFLFDNYDPQFQDDFYESITENSPYPLGEIETPVLGIGAEDDPYANIENVKHMLEMFPNASLLVVPDGGHPCLGHSQEVSGAITRFLNSHVAVNQNSQ